MAVQNSFYAVDGTTRTFPSTKHIATKQHCSIFLKSVSTSLWSNASVELYSLIGNSIVFDTAPSSALHSDIEIRVADTQNELVNLPSDIALVAGSIADVNTIAGSIADVNAIGDSINALLVLPASLSAVNAVANDITNVRLLGQAIASGSVGSVGGGGQLVGNSTIKGIQFMAQTTNEQLVIPAGTNAFSINTLTLINGASITVPNGTEYKIL